jgi:excisionase family DNA binding protein
LTDKLSHSFAAQADHVPVDGMLTVEDVARLTQLSVCTIRAAVRAGELTATKLRGRIRVKPDDLQAWIDACRITPAPAIPRRGEIPPGGYRELVRRRRASPPISGAREAMKDLDAREEVKRRRRAAG